MTINTVDLLEMLTNKLGKDEAKMIVTYFEEKTEKQIEQKATVLATKEDLHALERINTNQFRTTIVVVVVMILGLYAGLFALYQKA